MEKKKIDLFGFFLTLDHTFKPRKILDFALDISKYVMIQIHTDPKLNKQHLFTFTEHFVLFRKKKIYTLKLNSEIKKVLNLMRCILYVPGIVSISGY